jgi:trans-aconitate methyltransferase
MEILKKDSSDKSALWNRQYETGQWEVLKSKTEEARFNTLIQLTHEYFQNSRILEMGCGEGLLLRKIEPVYSYFLGIDISRVAISKALDLKCEKANFVIADMDDYRPSERFDLIIFNESVYYAKKPVELIEYYMQFLNEGGVVATSIFQNIESIKIVAQIRRQFNIIKSKETVNQCGTWHCTVFGESRKQV